MGPLQMMLGYLLHRATTHASPLYASVEAWGSAGCMLLPAQTVHALNGIVLPVIKYSNDTIKVMTLITIATVNLMPLIK